MRWTILIRQEGVDSAAAEVPVATIERDKLPAASELGLMHQKGMRILHCLQQVLLNQQCRSYFASKRACNGCGRLRNIKVRHLRAEPGL